MDSNVEAISFRVVADNIWPSSTNIAALEEIFCTVASTFPFAEGTVSVSP